MCFLFNINTDSYIRKLTATFVFQVFDRRKKHATTTTTTDNNNNNNINVLSVIKCSVYEQND